MILFIIFIVVPLVELALLLKVGQWIGVFNTIGLVVLTAAFGAYLTRSQGFQILRKMQVELSQGVMPQEAIVDGVMVLCGGLMLLTPGILTDILGFCLVIPPTRRLLKYALKKVFEKHIEKIRITRNYPL